MNNLSLMNSFKLVLVSSLFVCHLVHAQGVLVSSNQSSEGMDVYLQNCASCHDQPEATKSPSFDSLSQMGPRAISYALSNGKMQVQARGLSAYQIDSVVGYLSASAKVNNDWISANACSAERISIDTKLDASIDGFGMGFRNYRHLSAEDAGLTKADFSNLELAWAMGFPQTATMRAQPVVLGNTLFLSLADSGQFFALDISLNQAPCVKWVHEHNVPLRSSINLASLENGRKVLIFGDAAAHIQMLDASNGELLWRTSLRVTSVSNTTGMPVFYKGMIYAPVSSGELNMGAAADYECCTSHGAVVALNAENGEFVWVYHTMEEATRRGKNREGTQLWGPSGAPIWTTPAIDEKRGLLYVGTGQNTSVPATDTSDAVLAIDLKDGSLRWKFQATANDIFLTGCMFEPNGPNCPPEYSVNADWDFGASMIIAKQKDGSDIVLAGQKSGQLWALDPDKNGELVWDLNLGPGGPVGGIHWGMAYDGERVFAAINQVGIVGEDPDREPGLHAVDVNSGQLMWSYTSEADCSGGRQDRIPSCAQNYGLSAATLLVDNVVVQGSNDGYIRAFDSLSGAEIFTFDTAREFETVNGVPGKGGSIDNASVIAANGLLLVQSGYGLLGAAGNVLLAFKVKQ